MDKQPGTKSTGESATDLSLEELFRMFPDDQAASEWFGSNIWPNGRRFPPPRARLVRFVESIADPGSEKFIDGNRSYNGPKNHHTVNRGDGEYVRGEAYINGMVSF